MALKLCGKTSSIISCTASLPRRLPLVGAFCLLSLSLTNLCPSLSSSFRTRSSTRAIHSSAMAESSSSVPSIVVYVTVPNKEAGQKLASSIVKAKLAACVNRIPAQWWDSYGDSAPELQEIAIRILSLTCSATGCERNWSVFQHVHSKKRNRLLQARLSSLVYVKYNLQLETRARKKEKKGDNYDPICLSDMESDDEWITPCDDEPSNKDPTWLDVHEYFKVVDDGVKDVGGAGGSKKRKKGVESVYEWKGEIQTDAEELLIIKTRKSLLDALTEHVKANHEYETPEVIALPIVGGSLEYLEWLKNSTRD